LSFWLLRPTPFQQKAPAWGRGMRLATFLPVATWKRAGAAIIKGVRGGSAASGAIRPRPNPKQEDWHEEGKAGQGRW